MFKSALFKVFIILMSVIFYAQACPQGDLNGDCCVDMLDLGILAQQWLSPGCNEPGIVGHWLLDDASGSTAIDSSGYGYDGSLFGNPSWTNDVLRGWCLSFDGIDDYVLIGNESAFDISESITVSAWVKADASGNRFQYIVSKGTDSWRLYRRSDTGLYFGCTGLSGNNYILSSSDVLGDGQWHHVAGVYDSGQGELLLYVDGQLDNSVAASGLISLNDTNVTIGSSLSSNFWTGQIDDVRVYSRALSASEVALIKSGANIPDPECADFDGVGGINAKDFAILAQNWGVSPQIVINELMSNNVSNLADEDGSYSGWIEILNNSEYSVNLDGWYLTNDPNNLIKWQFPSGIKLNSGEFLVVFASGKDRRVSGSPLHTNFVLDKNGGYLAIVRPNRSIVYEYKNYPALQADKSYGIYNSAYTIFQYPTPETRNLVLPAGLIACWQFDESSGGYSREVVSQQLTPITSPFHNTEWPIGVAGSALRLDGYSTWLTKAIADNQEPCDALTVEAWVALEAYPVSNAPFINQYTFPTAGYFFGMDKLGSWYLAVSIDGGWYTCWGNGSFPKSQWVHVAGTFDRKTGLKVYLNGQVVGTASTPYDRPLTPDSNTDMTIGKDGHTPYKNSLFPTGVINGIIDEVRIYNVALTASDIATEFYQGNSSAEVHLEVPESRFAADQYRPHFHPIPPAMWTNEPHGLISWNGEYHLFYQKNPNGPYWEQIHWGHMKSADLVNWEHLPIAIAPELGYDQQGCWSGCSVNDNGIPKIMYTGVGSGASMCLAISGDGAMSWSKFANNPVIARQPGGYDGFRDPYIWKDGSNWYMIVGCGSYGNGTVLLYRSSNLVNWTFLKPLYSGSSGAQGYFWEMPSLVKITSSKYVLFINALYNSQPAKNLYWVGTWSNETFTPDYAMPKQMDIINWMLSPSVFADGSGELLAIGIVPEKRTASDVLRAGWAHLFCLPRVLHLNLDGTLYQEPVPALQQLRDEYYHYENLDIAPGQDLTSNIKSEQLEILLDIDLNQSQLAGITVLKSPDGTEQTRIYYDKIAKVMTLECIPGVIESGTFELNGSESLKLHVFVDHSVIDVFANGRAFATRAYPSQSNSNGVSLYVNGGTAHINSLKIWKLKSSVVRN